MSNLSSSNSESDRPTPAEGWREPAMFWLTVVWLGCLGSGLHLLQDAVSHDPDAGAGRFDAEGLGCLVAVLALTPLFLIEGLWRRWRERDRSPRWRWLWQALCPPLRIAARGQRDDGQRPDPRLAVSPEASDRQKDHPASDEPRAEGLSDPGLIWLPTLGWVTADDRLEQRLERQLSIPMIVIALLVLPVMAIDFFWAQRLDEQRSLALANELAGAFIWLAFAVEFLVMISVTREPWTFVRRRWLDLAIILLPLIAFLRVLRVTRLGRLLRLNQLTKVSRTARVFRFRTVAMRVWRALLMLQVLDRLMHQDDERKLAQLEQQLRDKERETAALRSEVERLRERIEAARSALPPEDIAPAIDTPEAVPAEIIAPDTANQLTPRP